MLQIVMNYHLIKSYDVEVAEIVLILARKSTLASSTQ